MSGFLSVLIAEAGQNLVTNPSAETATTGYTATAGAIARVATQQRRGAYSIQWTPAAGISDSVYYGTITLVNASAYTFALDVKAALNVSYQIYFGSTAAAVLGTPTNFVGTGGWQRIFVTWTENAGAARRLYLAKNGSADVTPVYLDGVDCKLKSYLDTYVDGDQPGCSWDGTPHASTSTRSAQDARGGREYNFDGFSTYLLDPLGIGMPAVQNVITPYGLIDGGYFQRTTTGPRVFTLTVQPQGNSLINLYALRQQLIDSFKPDRISQQQAARIFYAGNTRRVFIDVLYDGGLELGTRDGYSEKIALRFIAPDPYWQEEGADGLAPGAQLSLAPRASGDALLRDTTGLWQQLGTGLNGTAFCATYGPDGAWYVGGSFADAGGVSHTAYLAKWQNGAWSSVTGTSDLNGNVRALAFDAAGTLYVAGEFTAVGAIANSGYIFKVSSTGTVTGLNVASLGANAGLFALYVPPASSTLASGSVILYAAGDLSTSATSNRIGKYNGSTWSKFGSTTLNTRVYALAGSVAASALYAGGTFSIMAGISNTQSIAKWNGSAWTALSVGFSYSTDIVYALLVDASDTLYIAGDYNDTQVGHSAQQNLCQWNGVAFSALGGAFANNPGIVFFAGLALDPKGRLWAIGSNESLPASQGAFSTALFYWDGSSWYTSDLGLPTDNGNAVAFAPSGAMLVCYGGVTTAVAPAINSITNSGTAKAYPLIKFTGPGGVWKLTNFTTGDEINFNLTLATGEYALLDLTPTNRSLVSSLRGNIISAILPSSVFNLFSLLPGANALSVLCDSGVSAAMWWPRRHWSIDGAG